MDYTYLDTTIYYEKHGSSKKNIVILPGWGDTSKTFSYMFHFLKIILLFILLTTLVLETVYFQIEI